MPTTDTEVEPDADWERMKNFITTGTIIVNAQGQRFRVQKVNPKNYVSMDEQGNMWNVRRVPSIQRAKRQDSWQGPVPGNAFTSEFKLGSVVRLTSARLANQFGGDGLWTVIHLNNDNSFRLARLGGTPKNSYLKSVMTHELELVKGTFKEED